MVNNNPRRVVVGMTGATGQLFGVRLVEYLQDLGVETHLVVSNSAKILINQEMEIEFSTLARKPDEVHNNSNIGASIASGSFSTDGMLVAPCSMKTLSNIANGNSNSLITRAADVTLKERRPLVLFPREKPFNRIHLKNMLELTDAGAIIYPPFPSFYQNPKSINEMVERTVKKSLTLLNLQTGLEEWEGLDGK